METFDATKSNGSRSMSGPACCNKPIVYSDYIKRCYEGKEENCSRCGRLIFTSVSYKTVKRVMFPIQEKKINFLYIKLNTSCVRFAPYPLYSASCRCSSHAVASPSHHLPPPPPPPLSIPPFSPFNPASKALLLPSYLPPLSVLVLFTLSSNLSHRWVPIPRTPPPKHHHSRSFPLISNDTEGDTVKRKKALWLLGL